jgi:hypothetical protein
MNTLSPNVIKLLNTVGYYSTDEVIEQNIKESNKPKYALYKLEVNEINNITLPTDFPVSYRKFVIKILNYLTKNKKKELENINGLCFHRNNLNILEIICKKSEMNYLLIDIEPLIKQLS